uniref:Uncharacterized protein n=1 Tax=Rhizophora mucronata TaxID=61149 RepID=A0A2P2R117_RHIMU
MLERCYIFEKLNMLQAPVFEDNHTFVIHNMHILQAYLLFIYVMTFKCWCVLMALLLCP